MQGSKGNQFAMAPVLLAVAACVNSAPRVVETDRLPDPVAQLCGATEYAVVPGNALAPHLTEIPERLVSSLGYPPEFFVQHGILAVSNALKLCALAEGPLLPGDSVVRFVRDPPWPWMGRTYVIRLEARGRQAALAARVLALCRYDSLLANVPREFDAASGDTLILMPDFLSPGDIGYEEVRSVPRGLFDEVIGSLEERGFWGWDDPVPGVDGYWNYLEVQLGARYKKFYVAAVTGGVPLRLIEESGLDQATCGEGKSPASADWLRDPATRPRR